MSARSTGRDLKSRGGSASFTEVRYFADPRGQIIAQGSRSTDSIVVADLDLDMIRQVRNTWQFYRDRRPESYQSLVNALRI